MCIMTIHLPPSLENSILNAVHSGRYASLNDAMTEAASMLVDRLTQERIQAKPPSANQADAAPRP
jgi:Arc/MetJ-type ribon-helix-helix transcriptional regulator